jgi:hypothetical protein
VVDDDSVVLVLVALEVGLGSRPSEAMSSTNEGSVVEAMARALWWIQDKRQSQRVVRKTGSNDGQREAIKESPQDALETGPRAWSNAGYGKVHNRHGRQGDLQLLIQGALAPRLGWIRLLPFFFLLRTRRHAMDVF